MRPHFASALVTVFALTAASWAGPLVPPVGPVAPTHKTLTEVEPRIAINATNTPGDADSVFRIAAPGSYYLAGNVDGAVGKSGIEIAASGVSIDLMGFELAGVAGSVSGVRATAAVDSISVVNGTVRGWPSHGIDVSMSTSARVQDVRATSNGSIGIRVGDNAVVAGCVANANGLNGLTGGLNSALTDCAAFRNLANGIVLNTNGVMSHCSVRENGGTGVVTGIGCVITDCSVRQNGGVGINTSASAVRNCAVLTSGGDGIAGGSDSIITGCTATSNTGDGITVTSGCLVQGNQCNDNGSGAGVGAGVHATSGDNRLEGNNCSTNDVGIDIDAAGNIYVRNTVSGNTTNNWEVAAGNAGVIFTPATNAGGFMGSTGGVSLGSTDPNMNWTY